MSIGEFIAKKLVIPFFNACDDVDKFVEKKTGKGFIDRMTEHREKEEALKENNPALWAAKKLAEGTIKGITGASLHKD